MRNPDFVYAKTKAQISFTVTLSLITQLFNYAIIPLFFKSKISSFYPASITVQYSRFVSELVQIPKDQFSHVTAQIIALSSKMDHQRNYFPKGGHLTIRIL